ncbi:hypothetical protein JCM10908_001386 [Rhodotorula pacifica]|uniref:Y-family DNA polymerase n=1 Tax=Rhodotorula pacifica TaxID=1495444 RepID=UPI00316CE1E4
MDAAGSARAPARSPRVKSRSPSATEWTLGGPAGAGRRTAAAAESVPIRGSKRFEVPSETLMSRMGGPSDGKAGVGKGGIYSKEDIERIIYDMSKEDQERRDQETQAKAKWLRETLAKKLLEARGDEEACADAILAQLEDKRDLHRVIALIDADMFYAACHQLEDPSLVGKAFGVGGGMLTTASYEARKWGCRSAMPLFIAKALCPHIISLPLKPELYIKASKEIFAVLEKYGQIAPASLDEAYVDMTDYCANEGVTPTEAISRLRAEVFATTGLTVSAGVSPNKALSKIAADINKPDGQFVIDPTPEACQAFIRDQPLRKCYGIGRVTEQLLNGIGLKTVGDIYTHRRDLYLIRDNLAQKGEFRWLLSLYLGLGSNSVKRAKRGDRKSYGAEKTFHPTSDRNELDSMVRRIAKSLAKDVARSQFSGRTITLSIKHDNFQRVTRAFTPGNNIWIHSYQDMVRYGLMLLHKEMEVRAAAIKRGEKVKGGQNPVIKARLLGLRLTNLRDDRELARSNKLDGYVVKRPAKQSNVIDLLSDSDDDPDILHDSEDDDGGEAEEGDFAARAVDRLVQEAQMQGEDGDDVPDLPNQIPYQYIGGGISYRGGWVTVDDGEGEEEEKRLTARKARSDKGDDDDDDEQDNTLESKTRSLTTRSARNAEDEFGYASSDSDTLSDEAAGGEHKKRKSPSSAGPSRKKAKTDSSSKQSAGLRELTCPICNRTWQGSEAAMSGHVDKCLSESEKPKKKKLKKHALEHTKASSKKALPVKKQSIFATSTTTTTVAKGKGNAR